MLELRNAFQELDLSDNVLAEVRLTADADFHSNANLEWLEAEQCDPHMADDRFRKRDPRFAGADRYKPPRPAPGGVLPQA